MTASHPKTGDVFLVNLDPVKGSEQVPMHKERFPFTSVLCYYLCMERA